MKFLDLKTFLTKTMSMTEVYQPVIIKELLLNKGQCAKDHLAKAISEYDLSVRDYYKDVLMRWPKSTLSKHGVIHYDRYRKRFFLNYDLTSQETQEAISMCEAKIKEHILRKKDRDKLPKSYGSVRYRVIKNAKGKCLNCGIPASLRPIDIDHIIPQSKADKNEKVEMNGRMVHVDSEENLQALCFKCNREKRDRDRTDFRRTKKLVRDHIPDFIQKNDRVPIVKQVKGKALTRALNDKLVEEHEEYIYTRSMEELVDMMEVIISLGKKKGKSEEDLFRLVVKKRSERGGFDKGFLYEGDSA